MDRKSLLQVGLHHGDIDALYRGLFVHTVGWHDALKSSVRHAPEKARFTVMEKLWKLFILLLEHTHKTNYK